MLTNNELAIIKNWFQANSSHLLQACDEDDLLFYADDLIATLNNSE